MTAHSPTTHADENLNDKKVVSQKKKKKGWEDFVDFLKENECRITQARRYVFDHVFSRHDHFRADEVAAALASGVSRVSRGTVYHTLSLLVKAGMVKEIRDSDTHVHYEHIYGHPQHEHMICDKCGSFIEFCDGDIDHLLKAACERKNFTPRNYRIVVFGTCEHCRKGEV